MSVKKRATKKKPAIATETSESIALQTETFLKGGGVVETVQRGVSGQTPTMGRAHIVYAKKEAR